MKVNMRFEKKGLDRKLERISKKGQFTLDEQALKDSNSYIPMDQGELMRSGIRNSTPGTGKLIWVTPYARRLYFNPQYNFSTDKNSQAGGLWFEQAKSNHLDDWIKVIKSSL